MFITNMNGPQTIQAQSSKYFVSSLEWLNQSKIFPTVMPNKFWCEQFSRRSDNNSWRCLNKVKVWKSEEKHMNKWNKFRLNDVVCDLPRKLKRHCSMIWKAKICWQKKQKMFQLEWILVKCTCAPLIWIRGNSAGKTSRNVFMMLIKNNDQLCGKAL